MKKHIEIKQAKKRRAKMLAYYLTGATQEQVAQKFGPMTRQRAQQLIKMAEADILTQ